MSNIRIEIIGKEIEEKLLWRGDVKTFIFNVFMKEFESSSTYMWTVKPEIYEWLLENIGYEFHHFRIYDRKYFDNRTHPVSNIKTWDEWEAANKPLADSERRWYIYHNVIFFKHEADAVHFKLVWF